MRESGARIRQVSATPRPGAASAVGGTPASLCQTTGEAAQRDKLESVTVRILMFRGHCVVEQASSRFDSASTECGLRPHTPWGAADKQGLNVTLFRTASPVPDKLIHCYSCSHAAHASAAKCWPQPLNRCTCPGDLQLLFEAAKMCCAPLAVACGRSVTACKPGSEGTWLSQKCHKRHSAAKGPLLTYVPSISVTFTPT